MKVAQVRVWHSLSWPGQVLAATHCTQCPEPSHTVPPFCAQAEPIPVGGFDGDPFMQTSLVHWFPSTGTSGSSTALTIEPLPLHTFFLQSPGFSPDTAVPDDAKLNPHLLLVQARVWHSVSCPGQSAAARHSTHA